MDAGSRDGWLEDRAGQKKHEEKKKKTGVEMSSGRDLGDAEIVKRNILEDSQNTVRASLYVAHEIDVGEGKNEGDRLRLRNAYLRR